MKKTAATTASPSPSTASTSESNQARPLDFATIRLRKANKHDVHIIRDLLIKGFWDDPGWALIDLHDNPRAERRVFKLLARLLLGRHSYLILHGDEVIGHVALTPPNVRAVPTVWQLIRLAWSVPLLLGVAFTRRLVDFLDCVGEATDRHLVPWQPAVMLEWFTVKAEWRHRGIGLHVLQAFVTKNEERVVLVTERESCVRLYERVGFEVVSKHELHTSYGRACESWGMVFDAAKQNRERNG